MRSRYYAWAPVILTLLLAGCTEQTLVLTINADGTAQLRALMVSERDEMEQQIRMREMHSGMASRKTKDDAQDAEAADEEDEDAQLERKLRAMLKETPFGDNETVEVEEIKVTEDSVEIALRQDFKTLEAMFAERTLLSAPLSEFSKMVLDLDEDENLRLSLIPRKRGMGPPPEMIVRHVKESGLKATVTFEMPGEVLNSTFPETDGNATTLKLDPSDEESLQQFVNLIQNGITVTSKTGGLQADWPLDSRRARERDENPWAEAPVTDAGTEWFVEAATITCSSLTLYEEGRKMMEQRGYMDPSDNSAGISCRLHAPPSRNILSVESATLNRAVDDQGRVLKGLQGFVGMHHRFGDGDEHRVRDFSVEMELPASDAQAIEEAHGEVIVLTGGDWKTHEIERLEASEEKIDLSHLLPGTTLEIKAVEEDERRFTVTAQLKGPPKLKSMVVSLENENDRHGRSHSGGGRTRREGDKMRRDVRISYWSRNGGGRKPELVIKYPSDVKRQRVEFVLDPIDLF